MVQNRIWRGPDRYAEDSEVACVDRDGRAQTEGTGPEEAGGRQDSESVKPNAGSHRVQGAHARYIVGCTGLKLHTWSPEGGNDANSPLYRILRRSYLASRRALFQEPVQQ
jgi:hypothetical protein